MNEIRKLKYLREIKLLNENKMKCVFKYDFEKAAYWRELERNLIKKYDEENK